MFLLLVELASFYDFSIFHCCTIVDAAIINCLHHVAAAFGANVSLLVWLLPLAIHLISAA